MLKIVASQMLLPLALLLLQTVSAATPNMFWCSWAGPNQTLTIGGANLSLATEATIVALPGSSAGTSVPAGSNLQLSASAAQLVVPAQLSHGAYKITINAGEPFVCGAPDLWWTQGEAGNSSVAGGWLRVFGRWLALPNAEDSVDERRRSVRAQDLAERTKRAANAGDWESVSQLAKELASAAATTMPELAPTTARLCLGENCTTLKGDSSTSQWQARFWLPPSMVQGDYSLSVSNGYTSSNMSTFIAPSPGLAALSTVTILAASDARATWPTKIFDVAKSYGCTGGLFNGVWNTSEPLTIYGYTALNCTQAGAPYVCPKNCSQAVDAAIAAAGAAGGGVVTLGTGRWYLDGPLLLPDNVILRGAGMDRTAIYFGFRSADTSPPTMIGAKNTSAAGMRFGVEDLALYVVSHFTSIIDITPNTDGVRIQRVRVRANMFFGSDWQGSLNRVPGVDGSRGVPWVFSGGGRNPAIPVGGQNFVVSDCDLWVSGTVFKCDGAHPARFGLITNNTIMNGGACHWFDQAKQVIFENNTCTGNNPMTMGNNLDSYGGGYQQHVYLHANKISSVWGNDREVMTADGDESVGNFAAGTAQQFSPDGLNLTLSCYAAGNAGGHGNTAGGQVAIIAGGAAGQIRRITSAYYGTWSINGAAPACHRSFKLNKPFIVAPDSSSVFQAMPYIGGNIVHRMHYADTGGFQFYGLGVQNVMAEIVGERMGGLLGWGQWRACATSAQKGMCVMWAGPDLEHKAIDNDINLQNEYFANIVLDGLRADHQSSTPGSTAKGGKNFAGFGDSPQAGGHNFAMMDAGPIYNQTAQFGNNGSMVNQLIVWRSNRADANGGMYIGAGLAMTYENNHVANTPRNMIPGESSAYVINHTTVDHLFMRGNTASDTDEQGGHTDS